MAKKRMSKKIGRIKRKAVSLDQRAMVKGRPLYDDNPLPYLIEPAVDGVNLVSWADNNRDYIDSLVAKYHGVLFRGFGNTTVEEFKAFVAASSQGDPLEYRDRSTPRQAKGNNVYSSTVYPADQFMNPHNEGTYWIKWATKIYFSCVTAPAAGGQTPIYNVGNVYKRLSPEVQAAFENKKWMLVRNYNDGFGLPWQEVFQTDDKQEVEDYCRDHRIEFEWKEGDRLRTRSIRPAIHRHPKSNEPLWFNHAAFFHYSTLEDDVREALTNDFAIEDLPYNTYHADGSPIEPSHLEQIHAAYAQEMVMFDWQVGDIILLDNMYVAHGRQPYKGDRLIVVAMTEPVGLQ